MVRISDDYHIFKVTWREMWIMFSLW